MTEGRRPLAELLAKAGDGDCLRSVAEAVAQVLMETDVDGLIGRRAARAHRRAHDLPPRLSRPHARHAPGQFAAAAPKAAPGPLLPAVPGAAADVGEGPGRCRPGGLDRGRLDPAGRHRVQAMGLAGIGKSTLRKLCRDIDGRAGAFLERPLAGDWPCLWLDAACLKQREGGRITSVAATAAAAANAEGQREIAGLRIGPSEAETFWATFLKSLVRRGLRGAKLVISDAHEGLKAAIRRVMGSAWQRCRVHWMRNAQAYVPKAQQNTASAALRQAFIQPGRPSASQTLRHVADQLRPARPKPAAFIDDSEADVLAHMGLPAQHRAKLHPTNPLERLNKEIRRRADAVGSSPARHPSSA